MLVALKAAISNPCGDAQMTKKLRPELRVGVRHKRGLREKNETYYSDPRYAGAPPGEYPWIAFIDGSAPQSFKSYSVCAFALGKMNRIAIVWYEDQMITLHHYQSGRERARALKALYTQAPPLQVEDL